MNITSSTPTQMGAAAERITDGVYAFGHTANPGDGTRYVNGRIHKVWVGERAASRATAYYAGVIRGYWNHGTGAHRAAINEWAQRDPDLFALYVELWRGHRDQRVRSSWDEGEADARERLSANVA